MIKAIDNDNLRCPICKSLPKEIKFSQDGRVESFWSPCHFAERWMVNGKSAMDSDIVMVKMCSVKGIGKISFLANSQSKTFYIVADRKSHGPYPIEKLTEFSVSDDATVIYKSSNGVLPMVLGGALFGSFGAVAGSMAAGRNQYSVTKHKYKVTFVLDDIEFIGFTAEIKDPNTILRLTKYIEKLREGTAKKENKNDAEAASDTPDTDSVSEYRKAKEEMRRLGFDDYDEYLDYLEFMKKRKERTAKD